MKDKKVKVTLLKSVIACNPKHKRTVRALGLRRRLQQREHTLSPVIQGMLSQVSYLLKVEEL